MDLMSLIIFLAIGAIAGWLAGQLIKGGGFGLIGNIIVGIVGAIIGGFLLGTVRYQYLWPVRFDHLGDHRCRSALVLDRPV
jgi:uncharacterized membrane protein YeaQ/YmgE (transglycosylase-associated protein family)